MDERIGNERPTTATRLLRWLPALAFVTTFGYFLVDKNVEARTLLRSGRGLLVVGATIMAYAGTALVLRRWVRSTWVSPVVLSAVVVGLAAWMIRPYYVDQTANLALINEPVLDASSVAPAVGAETTTAGAVPSDAPPAGSAVPSTSPSSERSTSTRPPKVVPSPDTTSGAKAATATTRPPGPAAVRVSTGPIRGIDHQASGTASIIRRADGSLIVRFEKFAIEGAPDPQVYLAKGDDIRKQGGVHLGPLPGNRGDMLDMAIPAGTDAGPGWTVLIWCGRFAVPIANATQAAA